MQRRRRVGRDARAERFDEGLVRDDAFYVTTPVEHHPVFGGHPARQLGRETGLADARFARHQRDLPHAVACPRPCVLEPVELDAPSRQFVVGSSEWGRGARRKIAIHAAGRRDDGRVVTPAHRGRRKRRETLEVEVAQSDKIVAAPRADERADGVGDQDLATRSGGAQPRRLHSRHALIVAGPFDDITCADADTHPERDLGTLVATRDQPLNLRRRPDRVPGPAKRPHIAIARALDDLALMRGDRPGDQHLVLVPHRVVSILPERDQRLCRTDQIGEQQGDRAGSCHNCRVIPIVLPASTPCARDQHLDQPIERAPCVPD